MLVVLPMRAEVNRTIKIEAPAEVVGGNRVSVMVSASTDAADAEQIGFLHVEYSIDEGLTWTPCVSFESLGKETKCPVSFVVSATGKTAVVRARVAFRGGKAGDVDFRGAAIQWDESWKNWRWPPSKYAVIHVTKLPTVNRSIRIDAPAETLAGSVVAVAINARTDAGNGEQIGFCHADYSVDGGKAWTQFCYAANSGPTLSREVRFAVGSSAGKAIIRVRAAFRGGRDGDVDFAGEAIQWGQTWERWLSPPTKYAIIYVRSP